MTDTTQTQSKPARVETPAWDTIDANDLIMILRQRVSDLEYQLDIKDLQIRNLLKQTGK